MNDNLYNFKQELIFDSNAVFEIQLAYQYIRIGIILFVEFRYEREK